MAINIINTDSVQSFDYLMFPEQTGIDNNYLQQQFSGLSNIVDDVSQKFINTAKSLYDRANNSDLVRSAKAAIMSAKNIFHPNVIYHLDNLEQLMSARVGNQRFIMAYPELREIYHEQKCDGYSDTYVDMEPNKIGKDHYDFRRVMTGVVVDTEDGWVVNTYYEDLIEGDKELDVNEKVNILLTWDSVYHAIMNKDDPTNVYGGKIGG
jgi:hypothetical protein